MKTFKDHLKDIERSIDGLINSITNITGISVAQAEELGYIVDTLADARASIQSITRVQNIRDAIETRRRENPNAQ